MIGYVTGDAVQRLDESEYRYPAIEVRHLHAWAPDTYEGAPVPVAGFLAVASAAAGFAGLLQLMFVAFVGQSTFWAPISQSTTLARVAPFVADHRSTFPSFDTTVVSDANNFFVLDFILFLEYIESTFYAVNVPRFAVIL